MSLLKRQPKCTRCKHRGHRDGCLCPKTGCACKRGEYINPLKKRRRWPWRT